MKVISILLMSLVAFGVRAEEASSPAVIKTDLEIVCAVMKLHDSLAKKVDIVDLTERTSRMMEAGVRDPHTKGALKSIYQVKDSEKMVLWKKFAQDEKVTKVSCLK